MRKHFVLLSFAIIMLVALASANSATDLQPYVLYIVANGWGDGHTDRYHPIGGTIQQDGSLSFKAKIQFPDEQWDEIIGTVKDRHIVFTRTRPGSFVQKFDGWIFEKPYPNTNSLPRMAGTFSHNGVNAYGWYGWLQTPEPM
jgi:hypothetical protein